MWQYPQFRACLYHVPRGNSTSSPRHLCFSNFPNCQSRVTDSERLGDQHQSWEIFFTKWIIKLHAFVKRESNIPKQYVIPFTRFEFDNIRKGRVKEVARPLVSKSEFTERQDIMELVSIIVISFFNNGFSS